MKIKVGGIYRARAEEHGQRILTDGCHFKILAKARPFNSKILKREDFFLGIRLGMTNLLDDDHTYTYWFNDDGLAFHHGVVFQLTAKLKASGFDDIELT